VRLAWVAEPAFEVATEWPEPEELEFEAVEDAFEALLIIRNTPTPTKIIVTTTTLPSTTATFLYITIMYHIHLIFTKIFGPTAVTGWSRQLKPFQTP
jgi:hypothetical protein